MRLISSLLAVLALGACTTGGGAQLASENPDQVVCEYRKVTGTHRSEKICTTAAQRAELREATQTGLISRAGERPVAGSDRAGVP